MECAYTLDKIELHINVLKKKVEVAPIVLLEQSREKMKEKAKAAETSFLKHMFFV